MATQGRSEVPGTWIRGADGGLYFIPDADMETFRVPDALAGPTLQEIDAGGDVEAHGVQPGQLSFQAIAAMRGPLAIRDLAAAPAIIPPPAMLRGLRAQ